MISRSLSIELPFLGWCEFYDECALFFKRFTVFVAMVKAPAKDATIRQSRDNAGTHFGVSASFPVAVGAGVVFFVKRIHISPCLSGFVDSRGVSGKRNTCWGRNTCDVPDPLFMLTKPQRRVPYECG